MSDIAFGFVPRGCRVEPAFRWYVVSTEFHAEADVERSIVRRGMSAWNPKYLTPTKRVGLLFPGYTFMQADLADRNWQGMYTERGVDTLLGFRGQPPTPIPAGVLELLWQDCFTSGLVRDIRAAPGGRLDPMAPGVTVRVADGPFAGWSGVVRWSTATRIEVLLSIFGRDTKSEMPREHVEAA